MDELEIAKKTGLDHAKLKARFSEPKPEGSGKDEVLYRIRTRMDAGRDFSYTHYKLWHAIDQLTETPFRQATIGLLMGFAGRDPSSKEVLSAAKSWDLTHLICQKKDPKTGKNIECLNLPIFFEVLVPVARAYTMVRAAKLAIDRMQTPLLKWEPPHGTPKLRKQCEIITDRCELMSNQFGYRNELRQAIRKAVEYGHAIQFVQEGWFREPVPETQKGNIKEGLRFHRPHPAWVYVDPNYPPSSLNTDAGCEYVGHWGIKSYRSLKNNKQLWNTDKIGFGPKDFISEHALFFQVHGCVMKAPHTFDAFRTLNREASRWLYDENFDDAGVTVTNHFEKLIPKDDGLGDYTAPIWMRFLMASDDTVLFAEPLPSCPATFWAYDNDDARFHDVGMPLELAPWEVIISNLLSQHLLSVKQNLCNLTFINEEALGPDTRKLIENLGENYYRQTNMIPVSFRHLARLQTQVSDTVHSFQMPRHDVTGILNAINMCINLMERTMVMSAQEVGSAASHEQSAEEVRIISQSTGVRVEYASLNIDDAVYAWKQQIYNFLMAYGRSEVYAYVTADGVTAEELGKMGFTVDEEGGEKWRVSAPKSALLMEYFASHRDGQDRTNNLAVGTQMVQLLAPLAPRLAEAVAPRQVVELFNQVLDLFQLPRDWRLKATDTQQSPMAQQQWVVDQIEALARKTGQLVQKLDAKAQQEIQAQIAPVVDMVRKIGQMTIQTTQQTKSNTAEIDELQALIETLAPQPPPLPPNVGLDTIGNTGTIPPPGSDLGGAAIPQQLALPTGI